MPRRKVIPQNAGDATLIHGDCVVALSKLEVASVDLVIADPPYGIGYDVYDNYDDNTTADEYLKFSKEWICACLRVLKRTGSLWIVIGDRFVSELDMIAKTYDLYKRSHVIHYFTFGAAATKNFSPSHVHLLYYTKQKSGFTFNADDERLRVPSARQLVYNDARANPKGKLPDNTWILSPLDLEKAFTENENTWLASRVAGTFGERVKRGKYGEFKAVPQMPLKIVERIVIATSNPGDLVLDPLVGSGTSAVAAIKHGRKFIGVDISEACITATGERLANLKLGAEELCPTKPVKKKRKTLTKVVASRAPTKNTIVVPPAKKKQHLLR